MALVSDIQLQNGSVIPVKIDTTGKFTVAGLTATTGITVGETVPISLSGLFTAKSANNVDLYFQTTKADGDVGLYFNNDSNVYWNVKLAGTSVDSFVIETSSGDQTGRITPFSIKPAGHIGFGTINPPTDVIAEFVGNNALSAAVEVNNATNNIVVRIGSEATSGNIGTVTNSPFGIRVNSTDAISIAANGDVTIAGLLGQSDGHVIYDEGVIVTDRTKLDFQGSAVRAYDDGVDTTVISISAEGAAIPFWLESDTQDNIELQASTIGNSLSGDASPELGGDLDVSTYDIISTSDRNIDITPNGTGRTNIADITISAYTDNPMHMTVTAGTTWSFGWWQSSNGQWWLLGNTTNAATFTRSQAEFYIPTGDIADVPTS